MIRKCTSAGDDRRKKRQPSLIKADWFVRFAWLIHGSKSHVFCCKVFVYAKAKNVFFTGKDCAKSKKDDLAKHEIDVTAEAPDGLRDCERSREVGDYRL